MTSVQNRRATLYRKGFRFAITYITASVARPTLVVKGYKTRHEYSLAIVRGKAIVRADCGMINANGLIVGTK